MYRIIIADDEPLIIRGLKKMMEWGKMDTEVVGEAEDGEQLLNLLDTLEPDIIISDISMPEKTGLDVLKEINKRKLKTKVIFLSGFQEFSYAKEAVTYGAVDYLLKPVSVEELENAINRAKDQIVQEQPEAVWKIEQQNVENVFKEINNFPVKRKKRKFNSIYGETLKEPEAVLSKGKRIKGLDGNEKMGKSLGNAIYLSDSEEEVNKKVMSAVTDPNRIKKDDLGNPDICMVAYYHNLFTNLEEYSTVCKECRAGERGCVACKKQLAKNINEFLKPMREKRAYYEEHPEIVDKILMEGTAKAQKTAKETMKKVKKAMKLDY